MAQQGNHDQSIGSPSDLPVDGIAGSHPGTQEPAGADVNAGKTRHGPAKPDQGNQQSDQQSGEPHATSQAPLKRTGSFATLRQVPGSALPRADDGLMGSQGAGSAFYGGSGDSMQGGASSRLQWGDQSHRNN